MYTFRVYAINFNGMSQPSQTASFYVCSAPSDFGRPEVVNQTNTSITLKWNAPNDNGGCRITSYVVYRDDGLGGNITTEVNTLQDPSVRGNPSLNLL